MRITSFRPHIASQKTERPIHQSCLHPQILRQKNSRPLAQQGLALNASEILRIHLLWAHLFPRWRIRLVMICTQHCDGFLTLRRQALQPQPIDLVSANFACNPILPPIHQQRSLIEVTQCFATISRLLQHRPIATRQPRMLTLLPSTISHTTHYIQKFIRIPAELLTLILWNISAFIFKAMHLPQKCNILETISNSHPCADQPMSAPPISWCRLGTTRLVLTFACIIPLLVHWIITDRIRLLRITRKHCIATAKINFFTPPRHRTAESVPNLKFDLPEHLPSNHAHLIHNEYPSLIHSSLHPQKPTTHPILPRPTTTHRNTKHTM